MKAALSFLLLPRSCVVLLAKQYSACPFSLLPPWPVVFDLSFFSLFDVPPLMLMPTPRLLFAVTPCSVLLLPVICTPSDVLPSTVPPRRSLDDPDTPTPTALLLALFHATLLLLLSTWMPNWLAPLARRPLASWPPVWNSQPTVPPTASGPMIVSLPELDSVHTGNWLLGSAPCRRIPLLKPSMSSC